MSESERAEKLREIQLELFQIKRDYVQKRRELKRQLVLIQGCGQKRCSKCDEVMDVDQFPMDMTRRDHRYPWCRECVRAKYLRRKGNVKARGVAA